MADQASTDDIDPKDLNFDIDYVPPENDIQACADLPDNLTFLHIIRITEDKLWQLDRRMIKESSTYQNTAVLGHWLGMFTKVKTGKWTPVDVFLEEEPTNRRVADAWYDWYKDALKGEQPRFEAVIPLIETGETPERQRFSMPNPDDQKT